MSPMISCRTCGTVLILEVWVPVPFLRPPEAPEGSRGGGQGVPAAAARSLRTAKLTFQMSYFLQMSSSFMM